MLNIFFPKQQLPNISQILVDSQANTVALPTSEISIIGTNLNNADSQICIGDFIVDAADIISQSASLLSVQLNNQTELRVGQQNICVQSLIAMGDSGDTHTLSSNTLSIKIRPTLQTVNTQTQIEGAIATDLHIFSEFDCLVGKDQQVRLLLNQYLPGSQGALKSYIFELPARTEDDTTLLFNLTNLVEENTYTVRYEIDGIQSLLTKDSDGYLAEPAIIADFSLP